MKHLEIILYSESCRRCWKNLLKCLMHSFSLVSLSLKSPVTVNVIKLGLNKYILVEILNEKNRQLLRQQKEIMMVNLKPCEGDIKGEGAEVVLSLGKL